MNTIKNFYNEDNDEDSQVSESASAGGVVVVQDLESEIWKDMSGFEGRYRVSNQGRVKSVKELGERLMSIKIDTLGFSTVTINSSKVVVFSLHYLVAKYFLPEPKTENNPKVYHINGDRSDNRVQNLAWGTNADRMRSKHNARIAKNNGYTNHSRVEVRRRSSQRAKEGQLMSVESNIVAAAIKYKLQPQSVWLVCEGIAPHAHKYYLKYV